MEHKHVQGMGHSRLTKACGPRTTRQKPAVLTNTWLTKVLTVDSTGSVSSLRLYLSPYLYF
eukprot:4579232-Pyramimonas_sp.AAC.1